ncbi:hypothetical protein [Demequina zhanjiangensis]|uniref:Uncharacterized protein n=1 Tax=Demequina zhanjiangensis TaxID=3051659 RepID=A0ABT8G050_9MICO|nr:hypothetical protein [Demequina sp. SYSU T00b26]MDN4472508.1 hypothetical protein [Demequina sp. SYSU T00b26]
MSSTATQSIAAAPAQKKEYPWYAIPAILSMLMLSSGGMVALLGYGIAAMSSATY